MAPPVHGDVWLKSASMANDTTLDLPAATKWVIMAGMDSALVPVTKYR
jgi:hypothetical protein